MEQLFDYSLRNNFPSVTDKIQVTYTKCFEAFNHNKYILMHLHILIYLNVFISREFLIRIVEFTEPSTTSSATMSPISSTINTTISTTPISITSMSSDALTISGDTITTAGTSTQSVATSTSTISTQPTTYLSSNVTRSSTTIEALVTNTSDVSITLATTSSTSTTGILQLHPILNKFKTHNLCRCAILSYIQNYVLSPTMYVLYFLKLLDCHFVSASLTAGESTLDYLG